MIQDNLKPVLSALRKAFGAHYGNRLAELILYGSQARGEAGQDSDIDVLVVLKDSVDDYLEIEQTGEMISQLSLDFDALILCVFVSEKDYKSKNLPLFENVRREGIAV